MQFEKLVLVTRQTRLEGLKKRFNTVRQAKFYIEQSGGDFNMYEREHQVYHAAVDVLRQNLQRQVKTHMIERDYLANYLFTDQDLVMTVGIDGLVVNTAKYLSGQPIIAVNPDPRHIIGVLLPFQVEDALAALPGILDGSYRVREIVMGEVELNDGQKLLAFNDFFIGRDNHTSALYSIDAAGRREQHSSSGIIISTGAGATGWLSSIVAMARGVTGLLGDVNPDQVQPPDLKWETNGLFFVVREPFISKTTGASVVCGWVTPDKPLSIESFMPNNGVIFSDGVLTDFLEFNSGKIAQVRVANKRTRLIWPN